MTLPQSSQQINASLGLLFFLLGAALSALVFIDRCTSIAVNFPMMWYQSRSFHLLLCIILFGAGWWAHRSANAPSPEPAAPIFSSVHVYTKPQCELCDRALDVLGVYDHLLPPVQQIDITNHPDLESQFGDSIPVVKIDGRVRFRGIVSPVLLERLIANRQQSRDSSA